MTSRALAWLGPLALLAASACSNVLGYDGVSFDGGKPYGSGGASTGGSGGATGGAAGSATGGSPSGGTSSGGTSAGGTSSGGTSAGGTSSGGTSSGGTSSGGTGGSTDPYDQARQTCIDHMNQLRATKSLAAYQRWSSAESCVDQMATYDEQNNSPHGAWKAQLFSCNGYGSGQNECLGGGAAGIVSCLDMMWAEKDQPGCSGCDLCTSPGGCANCDFYGTQTGNVCGHYVNMSAKWFTEAACGFSSLGGWAAIDFQ